MFRRAIRRISVEQSKPNTRLLFGETLGNPGLDVLDIPAVSKIAHEAGLPLLVDATFTTPYLMKPFELGADLLYHSATKFLGGHGVAIGGVLVDSGRFDWEKSGKFPQLTAPYAGFHNMDFEEESGTRAFLLRARREGLRDFGACMAPMTAFQILQGIETLHLRMPRHVESTRKVVAFLSSNSSVEKILYPEIPDHPDHELAKKLLPKGCGAVFSFDIKGGREAGRKFIESLRVFSHLANVGDAKSLVIHPATTTHYRMSDEDLKKAGIGPGTIRLSIGLEDPEDLIADLARACARRPRPDGTRGSGPGCVRLHGGARARSGEAHDRLRARRGPRPFLVGPAEPLLRLSRLQRAGAWICRRTGAPRARRWRRSATWPIG